MKSKFLVSAAFVAMGLSFPSFAASAEAPPSQAPAETAADAASAPGDIIVTANRRAENVQRVAASISVLGGAALAAKGISNSKEIAQTVPNVTIDSTFTSSTPRIYIRGVGSTDFNPNASLPVGIYADEVYLASINGIVFQLFDTDRVEVLRGPQGTLYGRNTTAGAINYISRKPTEEFSGYATIRYGNLNDRFAQGAISGALIPGKLSARIAATAEFRDGPITNPITGDHRQGEINTFGARALFDFHPNDDVKFVLNLHGGKSSPHSGGYKARGVYVPGSNPRVRCSVEQELSFSCADAVGHIENSDLRSAVTNNPEGRDSVSAYGSSVRADVDLGFATLTSISAYDYSLLNRLENADGTVNRVLDIHYHQTDSTFSQEVRLTSPGGQNFNWIAGLYYLDQTATARDETLIPPAVPNIPTRRQFSQNTRAEAVFGRVDYSLAEGLKVTGGLRYTHEQRDMTISVMRDPAYFAFFGLPVPAGVAPIFYFIQDKHLSNGKVTGDLTVDYELTNNIFAYAKVSKGFKSGGFNGARLYNPALVTTVRPETITDYEGGIKTKLFDRKLTFNLSGFYYDFKNLQVYTLVPISGVPTQILDNASNATIYGAEIESALAVGDNLNLNANLGLLHGEFKDYVSATSASNYTGHQLPGAPKVTANLGFDYRHSIGNSLEIRADWNSAYRSRNYFSPAQLLDVSQGSFWLTNASVGFGPKDHKWSVSAWSKNLFDKQYYRYIVDYSSFGVHLLTIGDPRTYGLELSYKF